MRFMRGLMRAHQPRLSPVKRFHPSSVLPTLLLALRALGGQRVSQLVGTLRSSSRAGYGRPYQEQ